MKTKYIIATILVILFILATIIGNSRGQEVLTTKFQPIFTTSDQAVIRVIYRRENKDSPWRMQLHIKDGISYQIYNMTALQKVEHPVFIK